MWVQLDRHLRLSLDAGVMGAPQMISKPVSSSFLFSTALWNLPNSKPVHWFPDVVCLPLLSG